MEILSIAVGTAAALVVGGLAVKLGARWGIVDVADQHLKVHTGSPVPLGGAAVLAGAHVGLAVAGLFDPGLLIASLFIWTVGLVDDLRGLSPLVRLVGAFAAGVLLVGVSFEQSNFLEAAFWVVAVVVAVNAINLFDGLDALAGSVSTITFLALAWFAVVQHSGDSVNGLVLGGVMLGFLFWNRPPARMFLGDNGAYVVAVLIVWSAGQASPDFGAGVVAMSLLGMPLIDLGSTVLRRRLSGSPLFSGDRDHSYDILHKRGMGVGGVAVVFLVLQAVWVTIIVTTSEFAGDRIAAGVALVMGVVAVGLAGFKTAGNESGWPGPRD